MDKVGITATFRKIDPSNNTCFEVSVEDHKGGCCVLVNIARGESCRVGASHVEAVTLDSAECKALARLLLVAAGELNGE